MNHPRALFKFLGLSLLLVIISYDISAQRIDWLLEPIIEDADRIELNEGKQNEINLIAFKKDGKWGMKNAKNELLAPAEFDGAQVWQSGKYFDMREGMVQRYFDAEGYEIEFAEVDAFQRKIQSRKKIRNLEDYIAKIEKEYEWLDLNIDGAKIVAMNRMSGDTISRRVFKKSFYMSDEGYSIWSDPETRNLVVKDKQGKVVHTMDEKTSVEKLRSNRFLVRNGSKEGLLDGQGNVIFETEYEYIGFVSDNYISVSRDGKLKQLADLDGKYISGMAGNSIYKSKIDNKIIIEKSKYETILFDEISKVGISYPFDLVGSVISKSIYQVRNSDTLSGLYNVVTDEEIVPCMYRRVKRDGSYFMFGNYKIAKSKKRKQTLQYRSIIDSKGNVILQDSMIGFSVIDNRIISVLGGDKTYKIYNIDGTLIEHLKEKSSIRSSPNRKYFTITNSEMGYINVDQYLSREIDDSFDSVGKVKINRSKTKAYSVVRRGDKFGMIDQQGNIIIPIELDEIQLDSVYKKYTVVKKDGKWGVIMNPLYEE